MCECVRKLLTCICVKQHSIFKPGVQSRRPESHCSVSKSTTEAVHRECTTKTSDSTGGHPTNLQLLQRHKVGLEEICSGPTGTYSPGGPHTGPLWTND